jgi:ATP-dependent DNA helicase RecG
MNYNIFLQEISKVLSLSAIKMNALARLGIANVRDLLFHKPVHYLIKSYNTKISDLKNRDIVILDLTIQNIEMAKRKNAPSKVYCLDKHNDNITLVFFNPINKIILQYLYNNTRITVEGRVEKANYDIAQIVHPDFIFNKSLINLIEPIYPLTYGLINKQLYGYILKVLDMIPELDEFNDNVTRYNLPSFRQALFDIHKPQDMQYYLQKVQHAIDRLSLDEALAYKLNVLEIAKLEKKEKHGTYPSNIFLQNEILNKLNFTLSNGQREVITEIEQDQNSSLRMVRMLQGDVGSGKTLVALMTALNVISAKHQVAIMVPTDLLAQQHYNFFYKSLEGTNFTAALLTGKTKAKGRREILEQLKAGVIDIIIGTHSLFQEDIIFHHLGFVIIDEQHRFGVKQRLQLINKNSCPDILTMTATPIPRSLALALFGNIAVSKLVNNISNRKPIITSTLHSSKVDDLINAMKRKLELGEKIYWVCPIIDEQEEGVAKKLTATTDRYANLQKIFGDSVAMIHGQIAPDERDAIMHNFKTGHIHILVATTVIEVGIDVHNATLIIIEHAENFGLAQLHQLRGRVGRSSLISHCVLLYSYPMSAIAKERLASLKASHDGFYIAEMDLKLRGSGEAMGLRQSGLNNNFIFLDLYKSHKIIEDIYCNESLLNELKKVNFIRKLFNKENLELLE